MNHEIAQKWVATLRSGKYKPAKGALCRLDAEGNPVGYCCLGVLCEIAQDLTVGISKYNREIRTYNGATGFLPSEVLEWAGMRGDPEEWEGDEGGYRDWQGLLAEMNDYLDSPDVFLDIANFIEEHEQEI